MAITSVVSEDEIHHLHNNKGVVEFGRIEFLEIVQAENPRIIYKKDGTHFFFVAGLSVSTTGCSDGDFGAGRLLLPWMP